MSLQRLQQLQHQHQQLAAQQHLLEQLHGQHQQQQQQDQGQQHVQEQLDEAAVAQAAAQ